MRNDFISYLRVILLLLLRSVRQKVVIHTAHWKHNEEGESDDWTDKAHFPLHGRRSISAAVYFIDETAHGQRGLHLESASDS